jgi:hypothetical protein
MNRTILTLIGTAQSMSARQILLTLNMNRVQNAISFSNIKELLKIAKTGENEVLIYCFPEQYIINNQIRLENHRNLIQKYTPYNSKIIYTYENYKTSHDYKTYLDKYFKQIGIDACWNTYLAVEHNEKMLINLLGLNAL